MNQNNKIQPVQLESQSLNLPSHQFLFYVML
jgi:hypothetical protein